MTKSFKEILKIRLLSGKAHEKWQGIVKGILRKPAPVEAFFEFAD